MGVRTGTFLLLAAFVMANSGCGGGASSVPAARQGMTRKSSSPSSPIKHVVIIVQENRTFNNFFATYPGGDGTIVGNAEAEPNCSPPIQQGTIPLKKVDLVVRKDLDHKYSGYKTARDNGNMDGFDAILGGTGPECTYPYQYTDPMQIQPYWTMAQQYVLAEHMFTTQGSDSFVAHQDLIRGDTVVDSKEAMVDLPDCGVCWWGCDSPPGAYTHLVTQHNVELSPKKERGPLPCSKYFTTKYRTLRDLLDAQSVSWKYYLPPSNKIFGKLLSAFDVVWPVRNGPEWTTNVITPETAIFSDISNNSLPAVSWVIPDEPESDHPGTSTDIGPSWVASVVDAIGQSPYWGSTAIVIVWDDWGGFYDNAPPTVMNYGGLGFRVPAIIVSPYAKPGYISQTQYEFGSILKYIEQNWNLGSLNTTDARANSIIDSFDYSQAPITFKKIHSQYSKEYFIHRKPSYLPADTDL
jgi:phospholipase C